MTEQDTKGAELPPGAIGDETQGYWWGGESAETAEQCWGRFEGYLNITRAAYLDTKAKAERCEAAETRLSLMSGIGEHADRLRARIAELEAQISDARRAIENAESRSDALRSVIAVLEVDNA